METFGQLYSIVYVVSYDNMWHRDSIFSDTFHELIYKHYHRNLLPVHQMPFIEIRFGILRILVIMYCHEWLKAGWKIT